MKIDPIIAVKDVQKSAKWYQAIFGCKGIHGGNEFEILKSKNDEIFMCLHLWEAHDHPTMKDSSVTPGNGLIFYIRTKEMEKIRQNVERMDYAVAKEIQVNPNAGKKEFAIIDPDGYYLIVAEFHNYQG